MDRVLLEAVEAFSGDLDRAASAFWTGVLGTPGSYSGQQRNDAPADQDRTRADAEADLRERAERSVWLIPGTWSPAAEEAVGWSIAAAAAAADRAARPDVPEDWISAWIADWQRFRFRQPFGPKEDRSWPVIELPEAVRQLFLVSELLDVVEWEDGTLELWRTRRLRFARSTFGDSPFLMALRLNADAENDGDLGWHIHPKDRHGRHYGYKLLFDADRTQDDMSWELHSINGKDTPWGKPAEVVLRPGTAVALHRAALAALVRDSRSRGSRAPVSQLHHQRFPQWARRFQKPGRTSYVAHPPVLSLEPTPWHPASDSIR